MIETITDFGNIGIFFALIMLGIASYTDITRREVNDLLWIVFGVIGVALVFLQPSILDSLFEIGFSLIVAPFVLIVWRLGLFGGADAFAIIVLAVLAPQATLSENQITPFTVLTNTVLLSIVPLMVNLMRNIIQIARKEDIFEGFDETPTRRIMAMFVGYRAKNPKHCFSIEKKSGKSKKLNLSLQHAEYAPFCNKPNTWVTPGIPYMLLIAAGFVLQLLYGDIIFNQFNLLG